MILHIENAVEPGTLDAIIESLRKEHFTDGSETAGRAAKQVKKNKQLRLQNDKPAALLMLLNHLKKNPLFSGATFAKQFVNVMANQYQTNQEIGCTVIT